MDKIHILIVDESPDLAKSLGNLIMDVFGAKMALVEFAYNIQDGLYLASKADFHFIFMRVNSSTENTTEIKKLFKENSSNHSVKVIALTFNIDNGIKENNVGRVDELFENKDEVDVNDLALFFEKMR